MEYQVAEVPTYAVRDMTVEFDVDYLLSVLSDKLTEIAHDNEEIRFSQSIEVTELKFEPDLKKFSAEISVREEAKH